MIDPERIKRSFADQVRQQQAEITRLQTIINQRSVNVTVEIVEGLGQLVAQAQRGDANSLQVLKLLAQRLKEVAALGVGIALPNGGG